MSIAIVVGGQFGSEGKGAICGYIASDYDVAVRVGAPNAGHTLKIGKNEWKMASLSLTKMYNFLPCAILLPSYHQGTKLG